MQANLHKYMAASAGASEESTMSAYKEPAYLNWKMRINHLRKRIRFEAQDSKAKVRRRRLRTDEISPQGIATV